MRRSSRSMGRMVPPALGILAAAGFSGAGGFFAATGTAGEEHAYGSFLTRSSILWSSPQWQELRRVWRKMDGHTDPEGGNPPTAEESGRLRIQLNQAFHDLRAVAGDLNLQDTEILLLERLAYRRLDHLSYGTRIPMTRMMPPPVSDQAGELLPLIEARIDAVAELRREGVLTGDEMRAAFTDLGSSIELFLILESINSQVGYSGVLWMERWPMDADGIFSHLDSLRTSVLENCEGPDEMNAEARTRLTEEFDALEDALEETRSGLPALHEMLIGLELI